MMELANLHLGCHFRQIQRIQKNFDKPNNAELIKGQNP
jgi:hypothetical protein